MSIGASRNRQETNACAHPGCTRAANCKGPRLPEEKEPERLYCRNHAAMYNKAHNFFASMAPAEQAAFMESERTGHKQTWRFGRGPVGLERRGPAAFRPLHREPEPWQRKINRVQLKCFEALGLSSEADAAQIRERYAYLVKSLHPDSNAGDRTAEPELARIIMAFKTLKAGGIV